MASHPMPMVARDTMTKTGNNTLYRVFIDVMYIRLMTV